MAICHCSAAAAPAAGGARSRRRRGLLPAAALLTALLLAIMPLALRPGRAWGRVPAAPAALVRVTGAAFAVGDTPLPYLHGINYEGPPDLAWHMWDPATFSPDLIAADFAAAAQGGYD